MLDGLRAGLADFADLSRWGALLFGLILGFAAGIVPGIGGRVGLLLCLPLAVMFDPLSGAVFLLAMHSVVHTSGSVTPIAYGLPTTASEAATAIDGFQLQRQGRGAEALGASLSSSSFGGVVGALAFILAVPVVRPIVTNIGAPEFLLISLLGLVLVAALSGRHLGGGLAVAALGVLASTVGIDALSAQSRFTFGRLELWDGLQVIALVGGLFVIPEMIALAGNTEVSAPDAGLCGIAQDAGRHEGRLPTSHDHDPQHDHRHCGRPDAGRWFKRRRMDRLRRRVEAWNGGRAFRVRGAGRGCRAGSRQ